MTREIANRKGPDNNEELIKLNRTLRTLYQCNHALLRATNEDELFQAICVILVEVGGLHLAWVGRCEEDAEKTVRPVAMAGGGLDYLEKAKISWSEKTERGRGPTGLALRTGKAFWVKDIRSDPIMAPWRADAIARGYASCVALPLIAHDKRIGSLSLYAGEPDAFNEKTIEQYSDLANSLAYGISNLRLQEEQKRVEEALRDSEQRLQDIIDYTTAVIWVKDLELRYLLVNREYERRHLVSRQDIRGKTDFEIHPDDVATAVRANDQRVIEAGAPMQFEESVPSSDGERFYISSKFLLRDRMGKPYAVCGIATDITQQKRAEERERRQAHQEAMRADIQVAFSDEVESSLEIVLQRSAEAIASRLDAALVRIWTLNEPESLLEWQASAGQYTHLGDQRRRVPVGDFRIGPPAEQRKLRAQYQAQNDRGIGHRNQPNRRALQAFAGLPLIVEGRLVGVLDLFVHTMLEADTIDAIGSVADMVAQGIARKRAAEKIRENSARLSRASEVLRRSLDGLARSKHLESFVEQVLVVLTEQLGGHSSTLWMTDVKERAAYLHSVCQDGRVVPAVESDHPNAREPRYWYGEDPAWVALQMKRPFVLYDPVNDPELRYMPAHLSALGIRALLLIPLVLGEELVGLLSVRMTGNWRLDDEDLEFAKSLAQQATLAIELTKLAEQAKQTALAVERENAARERVVELTKANEALRGCLDALASVPKLDEFLGQVMGAMTRQLGAASSVLRLRNFDQNVLTLDLVFQDDRVMTPAEARYPSGLRTIPLDERQLRLLQPPATVLNLLDPSTAIPDAFRSYLLGIGAKTSLVVPLTVAGQLVGSVTFRFSQERQFRPEELEIARALASQASLAIQLTRLAKSARDTAVLEERNQLAGEIHDTLAQLFTGISLQLGAARKVVERGGENSLRYVERAIELAQFGLAEARRTAFSIQPTTVAELGLSQALQKLVERSNIPGHLRCDFDSIGELEENLPAPVQEELLRIAQEAMSNAVRHAKPTVIKVTLRCDSSEIVLEITDDGSGIADPEAAHRDGFGLYNMQARAKNLGAQFDLRTTAGCGTSVVIRLSIS
jgi:PAS domain S-box-containing protein